MLRELQARREGGGGGGDVPDFRVADDVGKNVADAWMSACDASGLWRRRAIVGRRG